VTTYEYDDGGRLVCSVTVREAEFTPDEVATLLASRRADNAPRGDHGVLLSEATDPANDPSSRKATGRFVVPPPSVDFAALALKTAKDAWKKNWPDDDRPLLWPVKLEPLEPTGPNE
jgi:hypothetical protein